jgi:hypothetical protein
MTEPFNLENIYHCCVHKTGSQWLKSILADEIVTGKTGMALYTYQKNLPTKGDPRKLTERIFTEAMPENRIISPLYMDYHSYNSIPKPERYKTFFIFRDPRDVIVSWYFSVKHSHPLMGKIPEHRKALHKLSLTDGLIYCIEYLSGFGLFATLESWLDVPGKNPHVLNIRFEDMVNANKQFAVIAALFSHCRIELPKRKIKRLLNKYSFGQLRKKSKKEEVSHYRKGVPGDWKEHFDERVLASFNRLAGELITGLGYES